MDEARRQQRLSRAVADGAFFDGGATTRFRGERTERRFEVAALHHEGRDGGSSDPQAVMRNDVSDERARTVRREFTREQLAAAFGETRDDADE